MSKRILQWNIRGYYGNFEDLKLLLRNSGYPSCVCLQETLLGDKKPYPPSNYFIYSKNHNGSQNVSPRGIAILIDKKVPHTVIDINSDLEAQAIKLHLNKTYTIVNIYISPQESASAQQINGIIAQISPPFLIVGDFNARSPIWGDCTENPQGRVIENLLSNSNMSILNTGSPTHHHIQTNTETCIDLALCSPESLLNFTWTPTDDSFRSDHYPIYIDEVSDSPSNNNIRYNFNRANWTQYKTLTSNPRYNIEDNIDSLVQDFNNLITNAADISIRKSNSVNCKYPLPFWNSECENIVRERKRARRKYRRTGLIEDKINLNRTTALAKRILKNARNNSFINYLSSINSETPLNQIYKKVAKISGKYTPTPLPALRTNGNQDVIVDPIATSNLLCEHFSNISSNRSYDPRFLPYKTSQEHETLDFSEINAEPYNNTISETELLEALRMSKDTAPGKDNISHILLRKMDRTAGHFLLDIFNKIYTEKVFPEGWRESLLIPILKPGKPAHSTNSYRPIALTSCICKVLEKIINNRLMYTIEKRNLISPHQYGFRKNRSTIDPLVRLHTDLCRSFSDKNYLVAIFFDITKAYDRTWKHLILKSLHTSNIRGNLLYFIRNFLSSRKISVRVGSTYSSIMPQDQGVPQGSVLSCTLFAVAINSVLDVIPGDIKKCLYVDDLCIWYSSNYMPSIERKLQQALNKIDNWTNTTGFSFSSEKTMVVRFHRKRGTQPEPTLTLNGNPITVKDRAKYLGLTFDERLTWKLHIDDLKTKCHKAMNLLKCLSRKSWGSDRVTLLRLYRTIIRPRLDYGCEVYRSAKPYILKKLDAIHHQSLRIASGAYRSSPTVSLCAETGELPLSKRREMLASLLYIRFHRDPSIPSAVSALSTNDDHRYANSTNNMVPLGPMARTLIRGNLPGINVLNHNTDYEPPWIMPENIVCDGIMSNKQSGNEHQLKNEFHEHVTNVHPRTITYYTDGSKSSSGVGAGVYCATSTKSQPLTKISSVYIAEIYAIFLSLTMIMTNPNQNFLVLSDSKSSLQSIKDIYSKNPIVKQIQTIIIRLANMNKQVRFCWVPAHVDIPGNEAADKLAKEGTLSTQPPTLYKNYYKDYYPVLKKNIFDRWQSEWETINNIRPNKLRSLKTTIRDWPSSYAPGNRLFERSICRLRIGHCHFSHKYLMERGEPPECEFCLSPLTVDHVLRECIQYQSSRRRVFGPAQPTLRMILSEEDPNFKIEKTREFLTSSGIINLI